MNIDDDPALLALTQSQRMMLNDVLAEIENTLWTDDALSDPEGTPEMADIVRNTFISCRPQLRAC